MTGIDGENGLSEMDMNFKAPDETQAQPAPAEAPDTRIEPTRPERVQVDWSNLKEAEGKEMYLAARADESPPDQPNPDALRAYLDQRQDVLRRQIAFAEGTGERSLERVGRNYNFRWEEEAEHKQQLAEHLSALRQELTDVEAAQAGAPAAVETAWKKIRERAPTANEVITGLGKVRNANLFEKTQPFMDAVGKLHGFAQAAESERDFKTALSAYDAAGEAHLNQGRLAPLIEQAEREGVDTR